MPSNPENEKQAHTNSATPATGGFFPGSSSQKRRKTPRFNADNLTPRAMCVAWIDIMGTQNSMLHSLRTAANIVGKLHADISRICDQLKPFLGKGETLEPFRLMDGAYIVSENPGVVVAVVRNVMRCCAIRFLQESDSRKKSMVRATIAWGNVVTGDEMNKCLDSDEIPHGDKMLENVMVGMPFSWCQDDEKLAPPFGIFVNASLREYTQGRKGITVPKISLELPERLCLTNQTDETSNAPKRVGWVLDQWWGEAAHKKPHSLPFNLYRNLQKHIKWLQRHPVEAGFATQADEKWEKSLDRYKMLIDEYFSRFKDYSSKNDTHTGKHNAPMKGRHQKQTKHFPKGMGGGSLRHVGPPSPAPTAPSAP